MLFLGTFFTEFLVFKTSGFLLGGQLVSFDFLSLFLEDGFNQYCSVLELISLGCQIEFVIKVAVNFLGLTILSEKSSQDTLPADPKDFSGHSAFSATSTFTRTGVVSFTLGFDVKSGSCSRVDFLFALHDKTILDKFTDKDSGVGLADLLDFVGIHPNSFLSALENLGSKSFLVLQTHHNL